MTDDPPTHPWIPEDAEPLPAAEGWDEFLTPLYCWFLAPAGDEVGEAMGTLADTVHDGRRPTAEQIREARKALDHARNLVETHYAALAPDVEPWGEGAGGHTPYGVFADQLRGAGYEVEYLGREHADD